MNTLVAFLAVLFLSNTSYSGFAPTPLPSKCGKVGDLSGNKKLGPEDMRLWSQQWARLRAGKTVSACVLILMNTDDLPKITERDLKILGHAVAGDARTLPVMMGDSNGDNVLSQIDYNFYYGVLEHYIRPTPLQRTLGDLNGNGRLDGGDLSILRDRLANSTALGHFCGTKINTEKDVSFSDTLDAKKACGCSVPPVPTSTPLPAFSVSFIQKAETANNVASCDSTPTGTELVPAPFRFEYIDEDYREETVSLPPQQTGKDVLDKFLKGIVVDPLLGETAMASTAQANWDVPTLNRETVISELCAAKIGCRKYSVHVFLAGPADKPDIHLARKVTNGLITYSEPGFLNAELLFEYLNNSEHSELNDKRRLALDLYLAIQSPHEKIHERDNKTYARVVERIRNDPKYSTEVEICDEGDFDSDKKIIQENALAQINKDFADRLRVALKELTFCKNSFHTEEDKKGGYKNKLENCLENGQISCAIVNTPRMPEPIYGTWRDCKFTD